MSKDRDRTVYRRPDGTWVNERNDAERASGVHDTQRAAIEEARRMLENQGGGELTVKGLDGKIRSKDTIAPGNDPKSAEGHGALTTELRCYPRDAGADTGLLATGIAQLGQNYTTGLAS